MNLRLTSRLLAIALFGAVLAACAPVTRPPSTQALAQNALKLITEGKPGTAADNYLHAADAARPPERQNLQMQAARILLDAKRYTRAKNVLDHIDPHGLDSEARARRALLYADLELARHHPQAALQALPTELTALSPTLAAHILGTRAKAATAAGQPLVAARARLDRQPLLTTRDATSNLRALWQLLTQIPPAQLRLDQRTAQRQDLRAWLDLALIARTTAPQAAALRQALSAWQARYPSQVTMAAPILQELESQWQAFQTYPRHIAVLLPLSGPFSPVARTLLDGIMSAYYTHQDPAHPMTLRIYNTGAQPADLLTLYAQAVSNGAQFVIGPLDRNQVSRLAASGIVSVPTLALNYVDTANKAPLPNDFYEFGLSPSAEARQVAEKASLDGRTAAVVLVPDTDWGSRTANAFAQRFRQLGGRVVSIGHYAAGASDFSRAIVSAFNIDQSNARARAVQATIGRHIKFVARRRQDMNMIFIAGDPRQARLLMPQIDFHHGAGLPVYSIANAFSGTRDAGADHDLDGLVFCDAPLLLDTSGPAAAARRAMHRLFPNASRSYPRLFGLGVDSFNIIPYLKRLATQHWARYDGLSGTLYMTGGHRLDSKLTWAKFVNGQPQVLHASPDSPPPTPTPPVSDGVAP
ncbi:penicillin-binding protein activator [Acidihalobacter ferrooxydans]|uniref:Penicillin-binding protein activator n=1 Tax=Acidihalobacter ferrooxydans TaxID=1765967 RepID=A0A1P8UEE0_9GAMM|nr:penicillin-binding protein activator [Acidihalobacter ferrooxydans]APZ42134.1 hypothetical protein BW247_02660 [Acidihalobacter ferrooxydans]